MNWIQHGIIPHLGWLGDACLKKPGVQRDRGTDRVSGEATGVAWQSGAD